MRQKIHDKTLYVWSTKFTPVKFFFTQPLVVMVETFRMSDVVLLFLPNSYGTTEFPDCGTLVEED